MVKWGNKYRDLKKGDVLRVKVGNKNHPQYGKYAYSICSGSGNGCQRNSLGHAIFVDHVSYDLNETLAKRNDPPVDFIEEKRPDGTTVIREHPQCTSDRWERFWDIEVMEE